MLMQRTLRQFWTRIEPTATNGSTRIGELLNDYKRAVETCR
ncbi:hypothetical protein [Streptomyces sp. 2P-4]|nr:hypothetical protein [Streptomyces sp. 2P-4]